MKNWKAVVGKVLPWAIGAVTGLLEALGAHVTWWPTAGALLTAFGWIFLSPHPLSGLLVLSALLIASRWLFLLAIAGYAAGQAV